MPKIVTFHTNYGHIDDVVTVAKLRELLDSLPESAEVRIWSEDDTDYKSVFEVRYDFDNDEVLLS